MIIKSFILILIMLPIIWIVKLFIYDPIKANKVYKLFKLRDKVCMEAMKGYISESDESYQLLMYLINSEIAIEKSGKYNFSITNYIDKIIAPPVENDFSIAKIKNLCDNEKLLPYAVQIARIISKRTNKCLRIFKLAIMFVFPLILLFDFIKNHNIKSSKKYTKNKIDECNYVAKKYSEVFNEIKYADGRLA